MGKLHFSQCWHHWLLLLFQRSLAWSYSSLPQRIWDWISQKWNRETGRYMRIQLKVYAFELGYSFFMVLGSMFLAQICLLPRSQIFISNILKPNWVDANNIEISKDYCQQGRQQQLLFQERKSVASQIEWWVIEKSHHRSVQENLNKFFRAGLCSILIKTNICCYNKKTYTAIYGNRETALVKSFILANA